ncbi:MAG: aminotransferase, partial [Treponema sp.]|nr:aminotransferase [Treponema sp.]
GTGAGRWIKPDGGYFITFIAEPGCAKRAVSLCKEAGVIMTEAGATHPYGNDPEDRYIRIAPTFPSLEELNTAMDVFCAAVKFATVERLCR